MAPATDIRGVLVRTARRLLVFVGLLVAVQVGSMVEDRSEWHDYATVAAELGELEDVLPGWSVEVDAATNPCLVPSYEAFSVEFEADGPNHLDPETMEASVVLRLQSMGWSFDPNRIGLHPFSKTLDSGRVATVDIGRTLDPTDTRARYQAQLNGASFCDIPRLVW